MASPCRVAEWVARSWGVIPSLPVSWGLLACLECGTQQDHSLRSTCAWKEVAVESSYTAWVHTHIHTHKHKYIHIHLHTNSTKHAQTLIHTHTHTLTQTYSHILKHLLAHRCLFCLFFFLFWLHPLGSQKRVHIHTETDTEIRIVIWKGLFSFVVWFIMILSTKLLDEQKTTAHFASLHFEVVLCKILLFAHAFLFGGVVIVFDCGLGTCGLECLCWLRPGSLSLIPPAVEWTQYLAASAQALMDESLFYARPMTPGHI